MNLDLFQAAARSFLRIIEEHSPLNRHEAEWVAQELTSRNRAGQADYLHNRFLCLIPTRESVDRLATCLVGHEVIVEVCAGYGLLRRAFVNAGIIDGRAYYATDRFADHEQVEQIDQSKAVAKYQPSLVICSWPSPYPEVTGWLKQWDELDVRDVLAIGPWPSKKFDVGSLVSDIPTDWSIQEIESASRRVIDVFGNVSRVYLIRDTRA